jgi:hypothetical protein
VNAVGHQAGLEFPAPEAIDAGGCELEVALSDDVLRRKQGAEFVGVWVLATHFNAALSLSLKILCATPAAWLRCFPRLA